MKLRHRRGMAVAVWCAVGLALLNKNEITYADIPAVWDMVDWLADAEEKGWFGEGYLNMMMVNKKGNHVADCIALMDEYWIASTGKNREEK